MDRKALSDALRKLRESKFPNRQDFVNQAKIEPQAVEGAENNERWLRIDRIERWVKICGSSLSEFFAHYENMNRPADKAELKIKPGFEHYHLLLAAIIESGNRYFIRSIEGNLYGMLEATGNPLPPGVPPHDEDGVAEKIRGDTETGSVKRRRVS